MDARGSGRGGAEDRRQELSVEGRLLLDEGGVGFGDLGLVVGELSEWAGGLWGREILRNGVQPCGGGATSEVSAFGCGSGGAAGPS